MDQPTTTPCSSCGAPISAGELAEGLAVRIDGKLICPLCVDTLPGTAQVKINQLRAIRGLDVTTYRVPRRRYPRLHAYSFTTTTQLNQHRRALQGGGRFDAPTIPIDHKPVPKLPPATRRAPGLQAPWVWIAGAGAAVVILGTVIALGFSGDRSDSTTPASTTPGSTAAAPVAATPSSEKQRVDYDPAARVAWQEASTDPTCPSPLLAQIAKELEREIAATLNAIEVRVTEGHAREAARALTEVEIPDDLRFRPLRERIEPLSRRIALARVQQPDRPLPPGDDPAPVDATPPTPAPDAPSATPPVTPPVTPVVADDAPSTPASVAWYIPAVALGERPGQNAWRPVGPTGRRLITADGSISGGFRLEPGAYRCWVRVAPSDGQDSTVNVIVGGHKSEMLRLVRASPIDWYPIDIPDLAVVSAEVHIQITAIGRDTTVHAIFLESPGGQGPGDAVLSGRATTPPSLTRADDAPVAMVDEVPPPADLTDPASADPAADAPVDPPATADPAASSAPLPALSLDDFTHKVVPWDPLELPPTRGRDDPSDARYTAPDQGGPYQQSELMRRTGSNHVALRFPEPLSPGSGVAMLVHPRRADREALVAIFNDQQGRSVRVDCPLDPMTWNRVLITAPDNRNPWVAMRLEDVRSATTEFLVGKTVITPDRAATADDLDLRGRALLTPTYSELIDLVRLVSGPRKQNNPRWINPSKFKILLTERMTAGNWTTAVRAQLKAVFREPWKGEDAPDKTLEKLVLHDQWLTDLFKEKDPKKAVVHPDRHHLLVVITAGNELQAGMSAEQGVRNFWIPLVNSSLEAGIIPVPVLGPSRVDADKLDEADRMWTLLDEEMAKRKLVLPKIDLRPARSISVDRMEQGHAQLANDLLCTALGELHDRLQRLKPQR